MFPWETAGVGRLSAAEDHETSTSSDLLFEDLVQTHYRSLYQFAYSLARNEADAADLTQQTFYIWAARGSQLREVSKARAWLFRTLHREFLQGRRRVVRFPELSLEETEAELPDVPAGHGRQHDAETVLQALWGLPEVFQAPLVLFYLEDFSYLEIAEILAVPLGTVKSRLARGINQLQRALSPPASPAPSLPSEP
jgi:RNA polymerase sigma-70 factor (ECF subfamily)